MRPYTFSGKTFVSVTSLIGIFYLLYAYVLHHNTQRTAIEKRVDGSIERSLARDCNGCFAYIYKRIIEPQACKVDGSSVFTVLLITSIPKEVNERKALRDTWLPKNSGPVRHVFLFGATTNNSDQAILLEEHAMYGDILQENFVESYFNLSVKVIMGYNWVTEECSQAQYIVRTACDNYINIGQLTELLLEFKRELSNAWFGHCTNTAPVVRDPKNKWFVSRKSYGETIYPPYCVGSTFCMSYDVMMKFLSVSADTPFLYFLEDCYFGFCALKFSVDIIDITGFSGANYGLEVSESPHPIGMPFFSVHPVKADEHVLLDNVVNSRTFLSKSELRSRVKLDYVNHGWLKTFKRLWSMNAPESINFVAKV